MISATYRSALLQPCRKFDTLNQALLYVAEIMDIPVQRWIRNSAVLKNQLYQRRLEDFVVK